MKKYSNILYNLLMLLMILIIVLSGCKEESKIIILNDSSGVSTAYTHVQIINEIKKESNRFILAWYSEDETGQGIFKEKMIDSSKGKCKIAKWFETNFDLLISILQSIPQDQINLAVRPPFEFSIFSATADSPWTAPAKRFDLWHKEDLKNKAFQELFTIIEKYGEDFK